VQVGSELELRLEHKVEGLEGLHHRRFCGLPARRGGTVGVCAGVAGAKVWDVVGALLSEVDVRQ